MKITLSKKSIGALVTSANAVVPRRCNLPVLGHLLFSVVSRDRLEVTATDLEQRLTVAVTPESVDNTGTALVPLAELKELRKTFKSGDAATIEASERDSLDVTSVTAAGSVTRFVPTMPVDEFPASPDLPPLTDCDIGNFMNAFRRAAPSVSTDVTRGALAGVYIDAENKVLVGTDGRRLTRVPLKDCPVSIDAVIPVTAALMKRLPDSGSGGIGIAAGDDERMFAVRTGDFRYACKGMVGTYPNYEQVIPGDIRDFGHTLSFGGEALDVLNTLAPHLKHDSNRTLFIRGARGRVAAGMESAERGCCAITLRGCRFEGANPVDITVNCEFLRDALKAGFSSMKIRDRLTPVCFSESDGGLHLIMPLRAEPSESLGMEFDRVLGQQSQTKDGTTRSTETDEAAVQVPAVPAASQPEENVRMAENNADKQQSRNSDLKAVEPENPVARLEELAKESHDAVKHAQTSVREFRKQVRTVKAFYRDREKDLRSREREMEKNLTLINRLQESIAA